MGEGEEDQLGGSDYNGYYTQQRETFTKSMEL